MTNARTPTRPIRHDGWTDRRRETFLAFLGIGLPVTTACRLVGMSANGAYLRRAADADFAARWAAAREAGIHVVEQTAIGRAIDGWSEPVTYRGRTVGSRQRFDNRLLLKLLDRQMRREDRAERRADRAAAHTPAPRFSSAEPSTS